MVLLHPGCRLQVSLNLKNVQEVFRTFNYRHICLLKNAVFFFLIGFGSVGFGEYWKMIIIGPQCLQSVILIPIIGPQCLQSVNRIPIIGPQCLRSVNVIPVIGPQCLQSVIIIPIIGPQCPYSVNLKSSSMSCRTLRGFCSRKFNISGILEHTHFQKVCISVF